MKHSIFLTRAFAAAVAALAATGPLDAALKRFDAPEPSHQGYLRDFRPTNLSFKKTSPVPADRHFLLYLPAVVEANATASAESNATAEPIPAETTPGIVATPPVPVSPAASLPASPPVVLPPPAPFPPADPFDEISTDDLVDELENERFRVSGGGSPYVIPFIPPYSMAPADFELKTRSRYIRRQRP